MGSHLRLLTPAVALAAVLLGAPRAAHACIKVGALKLEGYPRDGAQDVPLDVLPIYQLTIGEFAAIHALVPDGFRIALDGGLIPVAPLPDGGTAPLPLGGNQIPEATLSYEGGGVAIAVRHHGSHFEIVPDGPLLPHTQYTLEVRWQDRENPNALSNPGPLIEKRGSVHFRTGDAPYAGDAHPPVVSATQFIGAASSCDPLERSVCFSLPDDEALYQAQFEDDPFIMLARGSFFSGRPYSDGDDKLDCMVIHRRLPNGTLGEPARSCRAERTLVDVDQLDRSEGGIAGLECKSDGLYLLDRQIAELFAEQEQRAQRERTREEAATSANDEGDSSEPEAADAARTRKASSCTVPTAREVAHCGLGSLIAALSASLILRRRRSARATQRPLR